MGGRGVGVGLGVFGRWGCCWEWGGELAWLAGVGVRGGLEGYWGGGGEIGG